MFYGIKSSALLLHETKVGKVGAEGGGWGGAGDALPQLLDNDTSLLLA